MRSPFEPTPHSTGLVDSGGYILHTSSPNTLVKYTPTLYTLLISFPVIFIGNSHYEMRYCSPTHYGHALSIRPVCLFLNPNPVLLTNYPLHNTITFIRYLKDLTLIHIKILRALLKHTQ